MCYENVLDWGTAKAYPWSGSIAGGDFGWEREGIAFCWEISITNASKPALKDKPYRLFQSRVAFYSLSRFSLDAAVNWWLVLTVIVSLVYLIDLPK